VTNRVPTLLSERRQGLFDLWIIADAASFQLPFPRFCISKTIDATTCITVLFASLDSPEHKKSSALADPLLTDGLDLWAQPGSAALAWVATPQQTGPAVKHKIMTAGTLGLCDSLIVGYYLRAV
jgi:hypothetical protein